jgi:CRISPR-associated DxTHG motif protein
MKKVGLSFIGTGKYEETNYVFEDKKISTRFFSKALVDFCQIDELFVVMTKEAYEKYGEVLIQECKYERIHIPFGEKDEELWDIFDKIVSQIPEECELFIDITHGFRSQPFIVLAACVYIQTIKKVDVKRILYGAYEARNEFSTPVFDLTLFLKLMDWSFAISQFIKFGHFGEIASILKEIHKSTYIDNSDYKSTKLSSLASILKKFTDSLSISRVEESFQIITNISDSIEATSLDLNNLKNTKPFVPLLQLIQNQFAEIIIANGNAFTKDGFIAQSKIIEFYLRTSQYSQAITLTREAYISKWCIIKDKDVIKSRHEIENWLGVLLKCNEYNVTLDDSHCQIGILWSQITSIRNDINHAGMNKSPTTTDRAISQIESVSKKVIQFLIA